jgi:cytochrome c-type biogenesis protein CcmH
MIRALVLALALLASPAFAVQPDEMLADPALEDRARELSKGLRCLVCRNESIDESNADLARDMRILLRERIAGGDTDEEAVAFLVDRYGEYVLLRPTATGANLILWIAGPAMLIGGAAIAGTYLRRRAAAPAPADAGLSDAEKSRLADILRD